MRARNGTSQDAKRAREALMKQLAELPPLLDLLREIAKAAVGLGRTINRRRGASSHHGEGGDQENVFHTPHLARIRRTCQPFLPKPA